MDERKGTVSDCIHGASTVMVSPTQVVLGTNWRHYPQPVASVLVSDLGQVILGQVVGFQDFILPPMLFDMLNSMFNL